MVLDKPTKRQAQETLVSRDHLATLSDKAMLRTIAQAWPAVDQALMTLQRDIATVAATEEQSSNLNEVHLAFAMIHNHLLGLSAQGQQELEKLEENE